MIMSWIQIGAVAAVILFALVRLNAWKYIRRSTPTKEPLQYTLKEIAPKCDALEDFKAWKRLIDLVDKDATH
jgi:hypothetical protein